MKKHTLLILSLLMLVSCGTSTPTTEVPSEVHSTETPTTEVTTVSPSDSPSDTTSENSSLKASEELQKMMNSGDATYSREDLIIRKSNTKVYENYSIYTYDSNNKFEYVYQQISGLSSLEESESSKKQIINIYYDGDYSYSLDSDSMYLRTSEKKEIKGYSIRFDFSFVEVLTLIENDFTNEINGTIKETNANNFLKKTVTNVSDISFHATSDKEKLTAYEISYTQGDYEISYTFQVNYDNHPLELPNSNYIKTA